jgi:hypothetical protein
MHFDELSSSFSPKTAPRASGGRPPRFETRQASVPLCSPNRTEGGFSEVRLPFYTLAWIRTRAPYPVRPLPHHGIEPPKSVLNERGDRRGSNS